MFEPPDERLAGCDNMKLRHGNRYAEVAVLYSSQGKHSPRVEWDNEFMYPFLCSYIYIVTCMSDCRSFGLDIEFIHHLQVVTTNIYRVRQWIRRFGNTEYSSVVE
jgi:hypothetical protein